MAARPKDQSIRSAQAAPHAPPDPPPEAAGAALAARLWAVCSALPPGSFPPPWTGPAAELWSRLQETLDAPEAQAAAAGAAAAPDYSTCARALGPRAARVRCVLAEIRGLATAQDDAPAVRPGAGPAGPRAPGRKKEPGARALPGVPLHYEAL